MAISIARMYVEMAVLVRNHSETQNPLVNPRTQRKIRNTIYPYLQDVAARRAEVVSRNGLMIKGSGGSCNTNAGGFSKWPHLLSG